MKQSKASLWRITKRGDGYLRTLFIQGAKSAVMRAAKRDDHPSTQSPETPTHSSRGRAPEDVLTGQTGSW